MEVQPIQMPDFLGALSRAYELRQAQQQNKLNDMKMREAERGITEQEALRNLFKSPGFDVSKPEALKQVYSISPEYGAKLAKQSAELAQTQAAIGKTKADTQDQLAKLWELASHRSAAEFNALPPEVQQRAMTDHSIHDQIWRKHAGMLGLSLPETLDWQTLLAMDAAGAGNGYFEPKPVLNADGKTMWAFPGKDGKFHTTDMEKPPESSVILTDQGYVTAPKVPGAPAQKTTVDGKPLFAKPDQDYHPGSGLITNLPQPGSGQPPTVTQLTKPEKVLEQEAKNQQQSTDLLSFLNETDATGGNKVENLIKKSTGSLAGSAVDAAGRIIGATTEGGRAIAELAPLATRIIMMVPRMEGPQSDRDAALYAKAAGQLADPAIPAAEKLASLRTIKAIAQKYTKPSGGGQPPAQSPTTARPPITQEDLEYTAKRRGMTVEQVKQLLKVQ